MSNMADNAQIGRVARNLIDSLEDDYGPESYEIQDTLIVVGFRDEAGAHYVRSRHTGSPWTAWGLAAAVAR